MVTIYRGDVALCDLNPVMGTEVSMLPSGLDVAEGSMTGLLILLNIPKPFAVSATLIIRFCTLWFGVGIGMITLFLFRKKFI
ncbi:MAG: hypothetical protein ACE5KT_11955 [Methanosarcinales archaeon]